MTTLVFRYVLFLPLDATRKQYLILLFFFYDSAKPRSASYVHAQIKPGPPSEEAQMLSDKLNDVFITLVNFSVSLCIPRPLLTSRNRSPSRLCIGEKQVCLGPLYRCDLSKLRRQSCSMPLFWQWCCPANYFLLTKSTVDSYSAQGSVQPRDSSDDVLSKSASYAAANFILCTNKHITRSSYLILVAFGLTTNFSRRLIFADPTSFEEPLFNTTISVVLGNHIMLVSEY